MNEAIKMVPNKPDTEVADEIRKEITRKLDDVCATIAAAKERGFMVGFQLTQDGLGRQVIASLTIAKHF